MQGAVISLTVMEEDPFAKALDITNLAKEVSHPELAVVLQQNIQMSWGVESARDLLYVLRVWEIELFCRAQDEVERVPTQDGDGLFQGPDVTVDWYPFCSVFTNHIIFLFVYHECDEHKGMNLRKGNGKERKQ